MAGRGPCARAAGGRARGSPPQAGRVRGQVGAAGGRTAQDQAEPRQVQQLRQGEAAEDRGGRPAVQEALPGVPDEGSGGVGAGAAEGDALLGPGAARVVRGSAVGLQNLSRLGVDIQYTFNTVENVHI